MWSHLGTSLILQSSPMVLSLRSGVSGSQGEEKGDRERGIKICALFL